MKLMSKVATLILLIFFFVGFCVLLYPAVSQYWNAKVQSKVIIEYEKMIQNISEKDYSAFFEKGYKYNSELAKLDMPLKQRDEVPGYEETLNADGRGMIGYISIDKLQVELPIYHGTDDSVLQSAAGHLKGTSLPVGGETTHAVISAHRGLPSAKLFTNLDKMQVGDTFTIKILDQVLTYQVDQIVIVEPNDATNLAITPGKDYVTLLTCTPYGINTHRLLVRGHRIENIEHKIYYITSEAYVVDRLIVTPIVALPILFVLIMIVIFIPAKPRYIPHDEEEQ